MTLGLGVARQQPAPCHPVGSSSTMHRHLSPPSPCMVGHHPNGVCARNRWRHGAQQRDSGSWVRQLHTPARPIPDFLISGHRSPGCSGRGIAYGCCHQILPMRPVALHHHLCHHVMTVLTLGIGRLAQPFAQKLDRRLDGRGSVPSDWAPSSSACCCSRSLLPTMKARSRVRGRHRAGLNGSVLVTGLTRVQQIAPAQDLAGLTGIFYALTYVGFLFPTVIAALLPVMPYNVTLLVFAGLALISMIIAFGRIRRVRGPWRQRD